MVKDLGGTGRLLDVTMLLVSFVCDHSLVLATGGGKRFWRTGMIVMMINLPA